jgi:hypothetical protein
MAAYANTPSGNLVYGDTPGAAAAAIDSAKLGVRTRLVIPPAPGFTRGHIMGAIANGLTSTDTGHYWTRTYGAGCTLAEIIQKNTLEYGSRQSVYNFEPHVAERVVMDMLGKYDVEVIADRYLSEATVPNKTGSTINYVTLDNGDTIAATTFIDMTYEGDLAAAAGCSMLVGRESNVAFLAAPTGGRAWIQAAEQLAGYNAVSALTSNLVNVNPFVNNVSGTLICGVSADPMLAIGAADGNVQCGGFRITLARGRYGVAPFPKPAGYDPTLFEIRRRAMAEGQTFGSGSTMNGKYDLNMDSLIAPTDPTGGWAAYPTANRAGRLLINTRAFNEQYGWLWFLANDASVPESLQRSIRGFGLPTGEFIDNAVFAPYVPRAPYIREARRLDGQYTVTQTDTQDPTQIQAKADPVCLASYSIDGHTCLRIASGNGYLDDAINQLPGTRRAVPLPWQVPLRSLRPREVDNLLVGCAASMSHVGWCTFRIEHNFIMAGSACGVVAALATGSGTKIDALNYAGAIAPALAAAGIPTSWSP